MINRRSGQRTAIHSRRQMWYVYGTSAHKMYVYGGFISESLAMSKANEVMDWDNDYQTIQLPTTDLTAAKSMIKAKLTGQSGSLGVGTQKIFRGRD